MRSSEFARVAVFVAVVVLAAGSADAHLQGVWNGSITAGDDCGAWSSPARLEIAEAEDDFIANLLIESVRICEGSAVPMVLPMVGRSSGLTSFTATLILPGGEGLTEAPVTGSVAGPSMNISAGGISGSFTQAASDQPSTQFSGAYAGSVVVSRSCPNGPFSSEGQLQGSVTHIGQSLSGLMAFDEPRHVDVDQSGQCFFHDVRATGIVMVMARIEGSAIAGSILPMTSREGSEARDEDPIPFTGTISSGRIQGTFSGDGDTGTFTLTGSTAGAPPVITQFVAEPAAITAPGQAVTLRWTTLNAQSVSIDNGVGQQAASGFVIVRPTATTRYTLTATGNGTATAQVVVTLSAEEARVVVARPPTGFVQRAGEGGGSDSFVLANIGQTETTVTLANAGEAFFSFSPSTVTLPGRSHAVVTITGLPRPIGAYVGAIALSGQGVVGGAAVRIRMLSAIPPTGPVDLRPLRSRAEVRTTPGQGGSGSIAFRNNGTTPVAATAVSDAAFIVPETGVVIVPPGGVASVSFTIDPSPRPAERPIGGLTSRLSLVFLRGGGAGNASQIFGTQPATSTVSVSLVHIVNPGLTPATPPPLAAGEVAVFAAGLGNTSVDAGDLFVSSASTSTLSDVAMYLMGGSSSQRATLPPLGSSSAFSFPTVLSSAFGNSVPTGTAQVRSAGVVSLAAMKTNSDAPEGTYATALPVFRSDRGIAQAAQAILSGVEKSGSIETDVVVQELTGGSASFRLDFLAANGSVISSSAQQNLAPFAFAKIEDVVPAGTAAVRVANTSAGSSRIGVYGLVTHPVGDAWPITDPSLDATASDAMFIPLVSAGEGAETLLFVTNGSGSTASVTADVRGARSSRRRVVRQSSSAATRLRASSNEVVTQSLAPLQTTTIEIGGTSGYVRLSSSNAPVSASARAVREDTAGRAFGTNLPVAPASAAMSIGTVKRFAGVDDASQRSRDNAAPATYRTHLLLVETTGQTAKVRVNLHYLFTTSLASTRTVSSREFALGAGQFLRVADVAREIIGPQRDSFGDLRDMTLEVEVIEGPGRVLTFLHSVDNGSGDSVVRTD